MFKKGRLIFIKVPKFIFKYKIYIGDIWSHIYGVFGFIGLLITIVYAYRTFINSQTSEITPIIHSLTYSVIGVIALFTLSSLYYIIRLQKLRTYKNEFQDISDKYENQLLANKYQSDCIHNIIHYHRNINARLFQYIKDNQNDEKEKSIIKKRFEDYLVVLTSNLQNYFSFITLDNCSVSIKLLDETKQNVFTFFRDPINLNKRKKSDINNDLYSINDNTAFKIIMDEDLTNTFFYCDNLQALYDNHEYDNSNPNWYKLYNSTLVVPISMVLEEGKRDVIGFITVDNFKGKLAEDPNKEFLFGIGDLLYNIFVKYKLIF